MDCTCLRTGLFSDKAYAILMYALNSSEFSQIDNCIGNDFEFFRRLATVARDDNGEVIFRPLLHFCSSYFDFEFKAYVSRHSANRMLFNLGALLSKLLDSKKTDDKHCQITFLTHESRTSQYNWDEAGMRKMSVNAYELKFFIDFLQSKKLDTYDKKYVDMMTGHPRNPIETEIVSALRACLLTLDKEFESECAKIRQMTKHKIEVVQDEINRLDQTLTDLLKEEGTLMSKLMKKYSSRRKEMIASAGDNALVIEFTEGR